jgi:hypothetical protein
MTCYNEWYRAVRLPACRSRVQVVQRFENGRFAKDQSFVIEYGRALIALGRMAPAEYQQLLQDHNVVEAPRNFSGSSVRAPASDAPLFPPNVGTEANPLQVTFQGDKAARARAAWQRFVSLLFFVAVGYLLYSSLKDGASRSLDLLSGGAQEEVHELPDVKFDDVRVRLRLCTACLSFAMQCYVVLCYTMICYAILSYPMLCYAFLCYALHCDVV